MEFFSKFESLCKEKGITPTHAARDIGITQQAVSMWKKRGSIPKYETLKKIADYFEVRVEDLLGFQEERQKEMALAMDRIQLKTKMDREEIRMHMVDDEIRGERMEKIDTALEKSDNYSLTIFNDLQEEQLKEDLLENFLSLNKLGQIESVKRIRELWQIPYYRE